MKYRELIKRVQLYSGFSDVESKDALDGTTAVIALHLTEGERRKFASQLPEELQAVALAVYPTEENTSADIFKQFQIEQHIPEDRAKKQLLSAWRALKEALSTGLIEHIKAQLPKRTIELLH